MNQLYPQSRILVSYLTHCAYSKLLGHTHHTHKLLQLR